MFAGPWVAFGLVGSPNGRETMCPLKLSSGIKRAMGVPQIYCVGVGTFGPWRPLTNPPNLATLQGGVHNFSTF